jgi:hypothetical protein
MSPILSIRPVALGAGKGTPQDTVDRGVRIFPVNPKSSVFQLCATLATAPPRPHLALVVAAARHGREESRGAASWGEERGGREDTVKAPSARTLRSSPVAMA